MKIKQLLAAHLFLLLPLCIFAQNPAVATASKAASSSAKASPRSPAIAAVAAIDKYEASVEHGPDQKGIEYARQARLAVDRVKADPAAYGNLEILLTQVNIINLDQAKKVLGRPAPIEQDIAKYRSLRESCLEKFNKKQASSAPAKGN